MEGAAHIELGTGRMDKGEKAHNGQDKGFLHSYQFFTNIWIFWKSLCNGLSEIYEK